MVDKISPTNELEADQALITVINQSLNRSLGDIDELNLQRLKKSREQALNFLSVNTRKWVQLGIAASVAALLLIPVVMHSDILNSIIEPELEIVLQDFPASVQELDDMDMLMALEDTDA